MQIIDFMHGLMTALMWIAVATAGVSGIAIVAWFLWLDSPSSRAYAAEQERLSRLE